MTLDLEKALVIGIASSALFDLSESNEVFKLQGKKAYREFQERRIDEPFTTGVAFPFIRRLLSLNELSDDDTPLVEVIILSKNDPDTGLRLMRSIQHHQLNITRAVFKEGRAPYEYMKPLKMALFLSANEIDVQNAVKDKFPAGQVLEGNIVEDPLDQDLRVSFDFDGVLGDDSSERLFGEGNLEIFQAHELEKRSMPMLPGPLRDLLSGINRIQHIEDEKVRNDQTYRKRVYVSLVTARNAPAHERAVKSLEAWGVTVNDAFFLGGIPKAGILEVLKPHIYFDDQKRHLDPSSNFIPSVHVPFGYRNIALQSNTSDAIEEETNDPPVK